MYVVVPCCHPRHATNCQNNCSRSCPLWLDQFLTSTVEEFKAARSVMIISLFLRIATKPNLGKPDAVLKTCNKHLEILFTAADLRLDRHRDERVVWDGGTRFAHGLPLPDVVSQCKCEVDELILDYLVLTDGGIQWP